MFITSIRWRLQVWLAFLLVVVLTGFGITAYQLHRINRFDQIDEELEARVAAISRDLRRTAPFGRTRGRPPFDRLSESPTERRPPPAHPPAELFLEPRDFTLSAAVQSLFEEPEPLGFYFALWSRSGALFRQSSNAPPEVQKPADAEPRIQTRTRGSMREAFQINTPGECILVGRPIGADLAALRGFALWLFAAGGGVLALGLGGGWLLTSRAIRPIDDISIAARRIADGNLSERIPVADNDNELGRLATVLNSTFARLEGAFDQQKQFTADASHELRTPIAVIISEAQTTLARDRTPGEYRETVATCLDAAQQMRRLTHSLLDLARFDSGQAEIRAIRFDLGAAMETCIHRVTPIANAAKVTLEWNPILQETLGDPDRLSQVFINLLTNAIDYNRPGGRVTVCVAEDANGTQIRVRDTGRGISAEALPHIFKRFYRADPSRSAASGRCGLGLAISKVIVEAHGGRIEVFSTLGEGSTFTVHLPLHGSP